jgi:hypothetical protein
MSGAGHIGTHRVIVGIGTGRKEFQMNRISLKVVSSALVESSAYPRDLGPKRQRSDGPPAAYTAWKSARDGAISVVGGSPALIGLPSGDLTATASLGPPCTIV